jgi:hypothetical protein
MDGEVGLEGRRATPRIDPFLRASGQFSATGIKV